MGEAALVKILLLGDATVGKSQLLVRFAEERFDPNCIISIGVDTRYKNIACRGRSVKVQVWDVAGREEFRTLVSSAYFEKAHGALIVYDITNQASFENVAHWKQQLDSQNSSNIPVIAIGNKTDLVDAHMACLRIPADEESNLSNRLGIPFRSVSAKNGDGVEDAFQAIVEKAVEHVYGDEPFGELLPSPPSRCACACGWLQRRNSSAPLVPASVVPCPSSAVHPVELSMSSTREKDVIREPVQEVEAPISQSEVNLSDKLESSPQIALKDSRSDFEDFDDTLEASPWRHGKDQSPKSANAHDGVLATRSQHDSTMVTNPCNLFSALIRSLCECDVR